jgi:hypothetical protein
MSTGGLQLRDTKLVIFGSPTAATPVMVAAPLVALDLPLRLSYGRPMTIKRDSVTQRWLRWPIATV